MLKKKKKKEKEKRKRAISPMRSGFIYTAMSVAERERLKNHMDVKLPYYV